MLRVDRDDLGSWCRTSPRDDGSAGDERLLVRERQQLSGAEGGKGHAQAGESDDGVQHDVRVRLLTRRSPQTSRLRTGDEARCPWAGASPSSAALVAGPTMATTSGRSSLACCRQDLHRGRCPERHDFEPAAIGPDHIDRLSADRTRGADERDLHWSPYVAMPVARVTAVSQSPRPPMRLIPSAPVGRGNRSPARRKAARRTGRASRRGQGASIPCPSG